MKSFKFQKRAKFDIAIIVIILIIMTFWLCGGAGYIFRLYRQLTDYEKKSFKKLHNQEANELILLKNKIWNSDLERKNLREEIIHSGSNSIYCCKFETTPICIRKFIKDNNLSLESSSNSKLKIWTAMADYLKSSKITLSAYSESNIFIKSSNFYDTFLYLYSCTENSIDTVYICIQKSNH